MSDQPRYLPRWKRAVLLFALAYGCANGAGAQDAPSFLALSKGQVVGLGYVGRMVGDLDRSVAFYQALGFVPVAEGVDPSWRADPVMNRIHGTQGVESRMAKFTIESAISGKPFTLYLREFRGIDRRDVMGGKTAWEPGAAHIGIATPDPEVLWAKLRAAGMLQPRSWEGKLVARPGESKGSIAYLTDPDGMDIEILDRRPATVATTAQAARPGAVTGIDHVGLVVLNSDLAKGFYSAMLGEQFPSAPADWMSGDFLDSATGGHGNILKLFNGSFPEAAEPNARMRFELVEYLNRKKPVEAYELTDIGVSYVGFEVRDIEALLTRLRGAGVPIVSDGIVPMAGYRVALVRDPDVGMFVQLFERPQE